MAVADRKASLRVRWLVKGTSRGLAGQLALALCLLFAASPALAADYSDLVIDANTGKILHETNADASRFPASLTKMMTLYVVFDMIERGRLKLSTELTISDYDAAAQPSKLGLESGEKITVENAIKALVTASANDVARAIAENLGGDEERFAKYMTWQAKKLGMRKTTFQNASGLPDPGQSTTARDYVTLSLRLYDDFPQYFKYFKTPVFAYGKARYRNHNGLLFNFQGSDGIKTGYTRASGFNLAASVHRSGKHVIGVIFGGRSAGERNARMRSLLTAALGKSSTERTRLPALVEMAAKVAKRPKPATPAEPGVDEQVAVVTKTGKDAIGALIARTAPKGNAASANAPPEPADTPEAPGPFHIQIGAYQTEAEARARLGTVVGSAGKVLGGHDPLAVLYSGSSQVWYRARFAGFERPQADQACLVLKAKHIDCIVMRAN